MRKLLLLLAAGLMVSAFIFGCSTEDPWSPSPSNELVLSFVSGPSGEVAYGANISFSWTSRGGVGEVVYRYRLGADSWSAWSNVTTVNYQDVTSADTMYVEAQDEADQSNAISQGFTVGSAGGADTEAPAVWIVSSPAEGSFVATGSSVSISWMGEDAVDGDHLNYWYSFAGVDSDTLPATTITYDNVLAGAVTFTVWASDQSGNEADPASVSFTIQDATILYVDDFLWIDAATGGVDMVKERDQKNFYRSALQGKAFAEWDVAIDGVPTAADMIPYNVIVWCADSDIGANDFTWYDNQDLIDDMDAYLTGGGKLLVTGPWTIGDLQGYDYVVADTSFAYEWFAVDTIHQVIDTTWWWDDTPFDTLVAFPDSTVIDTSDMVSWDYWSHFTWAVAVENSLFDIPDSMKIDVAKNGDQDDYAIETPILRNDPGTGITTEKLFTWGLDVDGDEPIPYGSPIGHVVSFSGVRQVAMLNFDTYAMPLPQITQTFQTILEKFGE
ncbi:MAG: hypothetical protein JSU85_03095 [Candidatus Zixiibacteriota bacterium]|nr:MAG: hypothetical protein JSU85_03095 [candidate division Zixibacteria bacterium]